MSQASNQVPPLQPEIFSIYRGFYVLPGDILDTNVIQINFFVSRSTDDLTWQAWDFLGQGNSEVGFYQVHTGLDENTFYAYYCQYQYSDGSLGPIGEIGYAGPAQLVNTSDLNVDQLASKAYSTGLTTSGIFRGVIFETAAHIPKVRMDPTGIFSVDINGTSVFYLHSDGITPAYFNGQVQAQGLTLNSGQTAPAQIVWRLSGIPTGLIYSYEVSNIDFIELFSTPIQVTNQSAAVLSARGRNNSINSYIQLNAGALADGNTNNNIFATVSNNDSTVAQTLILDGAGNSSYLQLGGDAGNNRAVSFGTVTLSWSASDTASAPVTHTLGRAPVAVIAMINGGAVTAQYTFSADTLGSGSFNLHGFRSSSTTLSLTIFWIAIG